MMSRLAHLLGSQSLPHGLVSRLGKEVGIVRRSGTPTGSQTGDPGDGVVELP
jgi:hypothetical protein